MTGTGRESALTAEKSHTRLDDRDAMSATPSSSSFGDKGSPSCCRACAEMPGPLAMWPTDLDAPRRRPRPQGRYYLTARGWGEALGIPQA